MFGVNSIHSAGRLRSRSLCSVRCGRDFSVMEPFRYTKAPRSRSLRPLAFPDLLGKVQDGQNHPQTRKKKEKVRPLAKYLLLDTGLGDRWLLLLQIMFLVSMENLYLYGFNVLNLFTDMGKHRVWRQYIAGRHAHTFTHSFTTWGQSVLPIHLRVLRGGR